MNTLKQLRRRKKIQSVMWWLLPVIIFGGLYWPYMGYLVLAMMIFFLILAGFKGRYWCGWFCPRGSFLERILGKVSRNARVPRLFKNMTFRWVVFSILMGFMLFRLISSGGNPAKIGFVLVTMCLITTVIAIPLGMLFKARAWCSFCPMGTLQGAIGTRKYLLGISDECTECGLCEKVCPVGTCASAFKDVGQVRSVDCLKCPECVVKCPVNALKLN